MSLLGAGKGGKTHPKYRRPAIDKGDRGFEIRGPTIRRICRRAGIKRINRELYDAFREVSLKFLDKVMEDAIRFTEHARRKRISEQDVLYALQRSGAKQYGTQRV